MEVPDKINNYKITARVRKINNDQRKRIMKVVKESYVVTRDMSGKYEADDILKRRGS